MTPNFEEMDANIKQLIAFNKELLTLTKELIIIVNKKAPPEYMDCKQVAEYTTYSESTIKKYQHEIGYAARDRKKAFKRLDVDKWVAQNTIKRV
jgi:hypothetical protein